MIEKSFKLITLGLLIFGLSGCQSDNIKQYKEAPKVWKQVSREEILSQNTIPVFTYNIIKTYPHNVTSYTEGLLMRDGYLFEGTGRYNQSKLLKIDLKSGKTIQQHTLGPRYFGEGVTIFQGHIFQLTYKSNIGFIYDKDSFNLKKMFRYPTQGWGLTTDGSELIMSDGSAALIFLDPKTLQQKRYIKVSDGKSEVGFLNELEYINGEVFANVWKTNLIVRISSKTGKVTGWIDLTGINPDPAKLKFPYVLNGIAYDNKSGHLLIAGKCWPDLFEIELVPIENKFDN
ncbi:MAG: glutaminyl-peptide cyclotransferase [Deltaproteobacteria bacterium]|nr:glutaminyl-peptide cyclotransferase [Deltaproteobacteria bacterium]